MCADSIQQVMAVKEIKPVEMQPGLFIRPLAVRDDLSVVVVEAAPGNRFEVVHPEWELVYVLRGQADYDDGRSVRAGEAIINLPNVPHPFVTVGNEPMVIIEVKSPAPQAYLDMWGSAE